jgi:hypothetical protein
MKKNLLKEIKALGGDETDLDLLKPIMHDSDEENEFEDAQGDEKGILKELKHFMKNTLHLNPVKSTVQEVESEDEAEQEQVETPKPSQPRLSKEETQVQEQLLQLLQTPDDERVVEKRKLVMHATHHV